MLSRKDELAQLIQALTDSLESAKQEYAQQPSNQTEQPKKRFADYDPIEAMRVILWEAGGSMEQADLSKMLMDGGVFDGKKSPEKRLIFAYETNIKHKNIKREGTRIILLRRSRYSPRG